MFATLQVNGENHEGGMLEEDGYVTVEFDWDAEKERWRCTSCDEVFTDEDDAEGDECAAAMGDECASAHELVKEFVPLGWVNSAAIHVDEDRDQVEVSISTGDPRGAFTMRMYRDGNGNVRMEVPHPDGWFLHEPLAELSPGHYRVGYHG